MLWYSIALGSAFVFGLAGLFMKVSQMRGGALSSMLVGLYAAGTCGFFLQAQLAGTWDPLNPRVWIGGMVIGLGSAWGNLLFMRALDYGPASLTSPLTNANIVLVVAMGALVFGEPIHPAALVGVALLIGAVALLSVKGGESLNVPDRKWFGLVAAAMLLFAFRNGGLKVTEAAGLDNTSVLWSGYLLSWIWFAVTGVPGKRKSRHNSLLSRDSRSVGFRWGLAAGLCSYGGLQLYAWALAEGPSHLIAPIFATNSLVIVIGSMLLFRERVTALQGFALLLLAVGLVLVRS
ncbi:EamA family transporter [Cohnella sp. CFH 77786]|uniref:DMT family transporter n=1 Tax=Cohnella sp. CFH 77786 TaxID=2662265 RepID=UPI001EB585D2|nr:DMT family transporter [Cohnella sp. CFH 77786]MBW5447333.1 EamA family transporter [Cohnella sp. CFH 77786]